MTISDSLAAERGLHVVRTLARTIFALLTVIYLNVQFSKSGNTVTLWTLMFLAGYLAIHLLLIWRAAALADIGGLAIDLIAVTLAVLMDPAQTPPTLLLFLVLSISIGVPAGLDRFYLLATVSALIIGGMAWTGKFAFDKAPSVAFLLLLMLVMAVYVGILMYRGALLEKHHREATWRDPETGLISRDALLATGSWLLPLHDRLANSLTLVMLSPVQPGSGSANALADELASRLRRSDIAARYDEETLAVCLPCTTLTAAESLIADLRESGSRFHAAITSVTDTSNAMDQVFLTLEKHLQRAREEQPEGGLAHTASA